MARVGEVIDREPDGRTGMGREAFLGMLERTLTKQGRVPFDSLPWEPAIHLVIFAPRVDELEPGLYCLIRNASATEDLKIAMRAEFYRSRPLGCSEELPFFPTGEE